MRYEWTDGKRALALEDGSLYERGLIAEEAGQEEWLGADVTRAQSAVFRELLRLAEEHIASGNVIRSQQETVARLAERVRELEAMVVPAEVVVLGGDERAKYMNDFAAWVRKAMLSYSDTRGRIAALEARKDSLNRELLAERTIRLRLEEENRRLRGELLVRNEEIHEMDLESREEWPEPSE